MGQPHPEPTKADTPQISQAKLLAAIFENCEKAQEGALALLGFTRDGTLAIHAVSIVERQATGLLKIVEAPPDGKAGEDLRALICELEAAVSALPAPSLGFLTDLGSWGDLVDFGVTPNYAQKIAAELTPGKAAILAELEEDWVTPLDTRLEELGGQVIRTWCSDFEAERNSHH